MMIDGEHREQRAHAVDRQQVVDAERRHQRQLLVELEARRRTVMRVDTQAATSDTVGASERGQPHEQRTMTPANMMMMALTNGAQLS